MRGVFAPVLAAVWAAGAALPAGANTYYTSPYGDDTNPGTMARPWRTIGIAKKFLKPGDSLLIADGEYPGGIRHTTDGEPGKPITYKAINPGRVIVHGDQTLERDAITIYQADWTVIDGLVIQNSTRAGVWVASSNNVTVRNCVARNNGVWGIFSSYSDDTLIENNETFGSKLQHGIYVSNSGDRPVVRYNVSYNNNRCGIQFNGDGKQVKPQFGTRGDGIIMKPTVDSNIIYNNGIDAGAALNLISIREGVISNNLIYNNMSGGVTFYNDNRPYETQWGSKDNLLVGNTIHFRPTEGRWAISFRHGSTGNVVKNNVISGGNRGAYEFDASSSFTANNNLLYSAKFAYVATDLETKKFLTASEFQTKTGNDTASVYAEPKFVNPVGGNFHLLASSPARTKGVYVQQVNWDLDGNTIPETCRPDIGCFGGATAAATVGGDTVGGSTGGESSLEPAPIVP